MGGTEIGPMKAGIEHEGGQVTKGPFFAGDATFPAQLDALSIKSTQGVGACLDALAERTPLHSALCVPGQVMWSFSDVKKHSDALARGFTELGLKKGATVSANAEDAASVVALIAAEKVGLKLAADKAVASGSVGTEKGTFAIADISVYGSTPVGKAGTALKTVMSGAPGKTGAYLGEIFKSVA